MPDPTIRLAPAPETPAEREPERAVLQPFIEVVGIAKRYEAKEGAAVNAIEEITFDVRRGEFVSIVGPSGCGKSTLLKIIGRLLAPSAGEIRYRGIPVGAERPRLGMVFQDSVLLPWRTMLDNVCLPIEVMHLDRREGRRRAAELIELVGLSGFEDKYPMELSGGMQQRASIARALVSDPELLLMDEPFGALDALTREQMAQELQRLWSVARKTVVFVTHSISEAVLLSDRVVVMTGRPSRVADDIPIDIPRPRSLDVTATERFGRYASRIRALLSA